MSTEVRHDMVEASREVLAVHSRSFSWASAFLPADRRDDAAVVYAMCRLIDDIADEASDPERARIQLDMLRQELVGQTDARPLVREFLDVADRRNIDLDYTVQLIEGVLGDLGSVVYQSDRELLRYCYRVAGTVGLMMCGVLGVDDPEALPHAVDLGVAMQLTNICRDVREDASMGRVYLPADRLREVGVEPEDLLDGDADREAVAKVVSDLLEMADVYYRSADDGLQYIPARSRLAILVASRVYRAIGVHLGMRGYDALAGRTVVGAAGKAWWVTVALVSYLRPRILGMFSTDDHDKKLHTDLRGLPGIAE